MIYEPSFPTTLKDFSDPTSNLERLVAKHKLLKELMQQLKHSHQVFLQKEKGFNTYSQITFIFKSFTLLLYYILISTTVLIFIANFCQTKKY